MTNTNAKQNELDALTAVLDQALDMIELRIGESCPFFATGHLLSAPVTMLHDLDESTDRI